MPGLKAYDTAQTVSMDWWVGSLLRSVTGSGGFAALYLAADFVHNIGGLERNRKCASLCTLRNGHLHLRVPGAAHRLPFGAEAGGGGYKNKNRQKAFRERRTQYLYINYQISKPLKTVTFGLKS